MKHVSPVKHPRPTLRSPSWQPRAPRAAIAAFLASMSVVVSADAASGSSWPQWRGSLGKGVAPDAKPPISWSETEHVAWKAELPGEGTGTPIIWGDQIFIQAAIPTGKKGETNPAKKAAGLMTPGVVMGQQPPPPERGPRRGGPGGGGAFGAPAEAPSEVYKFDLLSLDRKTGKIQWQKTLRELVPHEGHHRDHGYASHSPITDGEHVFAWFGSRGLHAVDLKGNVLWSQDLGQMQTRAGFGEGSSPALHGDTLVVNWDHEGADFIAAFDKKTGKERWRQPRDESTTWTTPLIVEHNHAYQVIVCATKRVRSYDLETGKLLWECGGMTANVIPTPVSDFGMLYAISGFRGAALLAIKLGGSGDLTDSPSIAWKISKSTPYVPSPVLSGKRLYYLSGNNPILSSVNAKTGQMLINEERLQGPSGFYASPVAASGRIYLIGRNGISLVIKDGDTLEVLATNTLSEKFDASPALSGTQLFLRGHRHLYCLSEP